MVSLLKPLGPDLTNVLDGRLRFAELSLSPAPGEPTQAVVYIAQPWFMIRRQQAHIHRERAKGRNMREYTSIVLGKAERLGGLSNMRAVRVPPKVNK